MSAVRCVTKMTGAQLSAPSGDDVLDMWDNCVKKTIAACVIRIHDPHCSGCSPVKSLMTNEPTVYLCLGYSPPSVTSRVLQFTLEGVQQSQSFIEVSLATFARGRHC